MNGKITHSLAAPTTRFMHAAQKAADESLHKLGTGKSVNTGRDDPAALIAANRLASELRIERQSGENAQRAANILSYIDYSLSEFQPILLTIQNAIHEGANDLSDQELKAAQFQIDQGVDQLTQMWRMASFNGRPALRPDGAATDGKVRYHFDVGSSGGNSNLDIAFDTPSPARLGSAVAKLTDLASGGSHDLRSGQFTEAFEVVKAATQQVATIRGEVGAVRSMVLDPAANMAQIAAENLAQAISQIEDTDYAAETDRLSRSQTLAQATLVVRRDAVTNAGDLLMALVETSRQIGQIL